MGMSTLLIEKPSKIHNLSYFLFGYFITTLFSYKLNITFYDRIFLVTFFGGCFGTIIYYIKPVEKIITTLFKLEGVNLKKPDDLIVESSMPVYQSEVLYSKFFVDERVFINGAIFLGVGLLLSKNILIEYQLESYYIYLIYFSPLLILSGIWEIKNLVKRKMKTVVYYYTFYNYIREREELLTALEAKDWITAEKITESQWDDMWHPEDTMPIFIQYRGLCPKCISIVTHSEDQEYCPECGTKLISRCPKCNKRISLDEEIPKHCTYCGEKFSAAH